MPENKPTGDEAIARTNDRLYLPLTQMDLVRRLVRNFGLRPVVDAVGCAAVELLDNGETVKNEYGDPMDSQDVHTAAANLTNGDLY